MQVGVEVGHEAETLGVVREDRDEVLDGLYAGGLRAVLAEEHGDVDALVREELVDDRGAGAALAVPGPLEQALGPELAGPVDPRSGERGEDGHVDVRVDEGVSVEHGRLRGP